jgi:fibronectin-binding autotransporter adhesin
MRTSILPGRLGSSAFLFSRAAVVALALLVSTCVSRAALVAYWNFDETTGTNVFDLAGNTTRTNNGFFATAPETPTRVPGRLGNAVAFTWQAANNPASGRRVIVPYHTNLALNGPFSISFWYRPDAPFPAGTFPGIMRLGSQGATAPYGWGFYRQNNMVLKRGNIQPGNFAAMNLGLWNHLAVTYNGVLASSNTQFYLNGVRMNPFVATNGWTNIAATTIFEMGRMDGFDQATLDELALWGDEALSPGKILSIYKVPTSLLLDYTIADLRPLWGVFDAAGSSNAVVKGTTWSYAATVPGSTNDGDAYLVGGSTMYVVLGGGKGVTAPVSILSGLFSPAGVGVAGTIAPPVGLTATNANLFFDLTTANTPGGLTNDLIDVTGDLVIANSSVSIDPLAPLLGGTYRLINYSGAKTGSLTVSNQTRYTVAIDESVTNEISLNISGTNGNIRWDSTTSGAWDLGTSNWFNLDGAVADRYYQGDTVLFDDSGAFTTNITVATAVFPRSITVNSATRPYIFTGTEQIGGMAEGLLKSGASSLTLSTPNTFSGDVAVNGGTLRLGNAAALGTTNGQTIIAGGTLDLAGFGTALESITVQGAGVNNAGAIVNTGGGLTGAAGVRGRITLTGDAMFGGPNRWDPFNAPFLGNGFKLTKVAGNEIAMTGQGDTGLGDIDIVQGTLTFQGSSRPGDPAKTITISNNAAQAYWAVGAVPFNKPIVIRQSGILRNNTSGGTDVATNLNTVTLLGDATMEMSANIALLGEVSGAGALLKTGGGTLYLGGTNTYTGRTSLGAGRVAMLDTGSINGSPRIDIASAAIFDVSRLAGGYSLAPGQTIAGNGTVAGSLIAPSNTTVLVGGQNIPSTLRVTNGLTLSGGTLTFELNAATTEGGNVNDLLTVGGNLNLTDVTKISVNPLALLTASSTYTLISYTGTLSGSVANLVVDSGSRYTFSLSDATPGKITITVTGGAAAELSWLGITPGAETVWDIQTTPNWSDVLGQAVFFGGDQAIFDNFGIETNVDLVGTLTPSTIRVDNDTAEQNGVDYKFQGTGKLSGSSSLTKRFGGKLTIANTNVNDYIGFTTIEGGTLQVGVGGTWGNLGTGPITNNGTLIYSRSDNLTFTNQLAGNGSLVKLNTNGLVLPLNNSNYSGTITVTGGVVRASITNGFGNDTGGTAIGAGATLEVNGQSLGAEPVTVSGTGFGGTGAIVNTVSATLANNALRFLTLAGDTTVGGSQRWDVRAAPSAALSTGGNGYSLTKVGANQVSVVDATVDPALGDLNILAGLLSFELSSGAGDPNATVNASPNAALQLWGRTTDFVKKGFLTGGRNLVVPSGGGSANWVGSITVSNTVMIESAGTGITITDPVIGPGSLVKTGAAVLVLSGDNVYAGNTTNVAGTLQLGGGTTAGSVLSSVIHNLGNLSIFRSDAYSLTNRITGSGTIHVRTAAGMSLDLPTAYSGSLSVGNLSYGRLITPPSFNATLVNYFLGDSSGINGDAVQLGGTVTVTSQMRVGHWPSSATSTFTMGAGTLTLTGVPTGVPNPGGQPEQNGILYLGIDGTGIFVQTGGVVSAHGIVLDGRANSTGGGDGIDRFILNGGRFNVGPSAIKSGNLDANASVSIQLGGGTLASSANWTSVLAMTLTGTNGSTTFDTGSNSNVLTGAITGLGGLVKTGSGTLALTGNDGYEGGTVVNQGVLLVRGTVGAGLSSVIVDGGTLNSDGTINDDVVINSGGTLAVGSGIARLQVINGVTLSGTTLLDLNKSGTLTNDQVTAASISLGGTLSVTATGSALAPGDTFKLFNAPIYSGAFTTLNLPTLTSNYVWNVSNLAVDGTISVTQPAPRIVFLRTGNSIELTWSNGFSDYTLQAQTNAITVGIQATNWVDVPTVTNSATLTIDPGNPSVFYRLIKP